MGRGIGGGAGVCEEVDALELAGVAGLVLPLPAAIVGGFWKMLEGATSEAKL